MKRTLLKSDTIIEIILNYGFDGKEHTYSELVGARVIIFYVTDTSNETRAIIFTSSTGRYTNFVIGAESESITYYNGLFTLSNRNSGFIIDKIIAIK